MCTANSRVKDPPIQPRTWTVPQNRIIFPMSQKPNKALIPCSNQTWQWTIHHLKTRGCSIADLWLPEGISPQFQIHLGKLSSFTGKVLPAMGMIPESDSHQSSDGNYLEIIIVYREIIIVYREIIILYREIIIVYREIIILYRKIIKLYPEKSLNGRKKKHQTVPRNHHIVPSNHDIVPRKHRIVPRNHHIVPRNHHSVPRNHHIVPKNHQIVPREIIKW